MVQTKQPSGLTGVSIEANGKKATLTGKQWDDLTERLIAGEHVILTDGKPDERASVPNDLMFDGEFMTAQRIQEIADALIEKRYELEHLQDVDIDYWWKKKGGKAGGQPTFGKIQLAKGLLGHYADHARYILWIAADHCLESKITNWQLEALVFSKLLATTYDEEEGVFGVRPPEFTGFVAELDRYGAWQPGLVKMARQAQQMRFPLPEEDESEGEE